MHWLVTGCSSGLGLELARAIASLPSQKLTATSRNPSSTPDAVSEITSHPNASWEPLDVSSPSFESQLSTITSQHGTIDVLINNAAIAIGGAVENTPLSLIRTQYETNVFGLVRAIQAVLPSMRSSPSTESAIVNISSSTFWNPPPGISFYASTKWAVEGLSAALAAELAPFHIRVLLAQPGGMDTKFASQDKIPTHMVPLPEEYKGTPAEYVMQFVNNPEPKFSLSPEKAARAIVEEVLRPTVVVGKDGEEPRKVLRLQLGKETVGNLKTAVKGYQEDGEAFEKKGLACDDD
ncbi:putative short chain oxidoreductase/dehydrogenase [Periconia macrospinosa]|uniref:Putative short chain oxidoreductase/dehydrogenase n=1 Tax=Periconia macrospinosa TaxID=97972 RepID=A0A2V1DQ75_9PLEO|nr:putative short chain oxidoreductase/dehydrogenase [Periconia macrospinosa]